ncbi:MAG: hypothetical protein K6V36_05355 [Anaerolineae bacterium]|nr:hypothetical protein [Anaerolineae bacterium]
MREVLRRALLLFGLLAGVWLVLWSPLQLLRVEPIDWEAERRHALGRALDSQTLLGLLTGEDTSQLHLAPEAHGALDAFIAHETEGRLIVVRGPLWAGFWSAVASTVLGQPSSPAWQARLGRDLFDDSLFFRADEPPFDSLVGAFDEPGNYRYLRVESDGNTQYLGVCLGYVQDSIRYAPGHLAFPYRHCGLWVILLSVGAYALIPWPRPPKEGLWYGRIRLMDALGAVTVALFFALPIIITNDNSFGEGPFASGWVWLTAVFWLLAAICVAILALAAWYATLRLELENGRAVYRSLRGMATFGLGEVTRVEIARQTAPAWLRWAMVIASLGNWRAAGQAALLSVPRYAFRLHLRAGRALTFASEGLRGIVPVLGRLRAHGAVIDRRAYGLLGIEPSDPRLDAPSPHPRADVLGPMLLALLVAALGWGLYRTRVPAAPAIEAGVLSSQPFALPTEESASTSPEILAEEQRILEELETLSQRLGEISESLRTASKEEAEALQREAEDILRRVEELDTEFSRLRRETPSP